jgi:hypothetical protein
MNANNENFLDIVPTTEQYLTRCPFCAEEIQQAAIKCKHCGSAILFDGSTIENPTEEDKVEYEENPPMFRNHPFYFVISLGLCFVGIGFVIFLYWAIKKYSYKLTVSKYKTSFRTGVFSKKTSEVFHSDVKNIQVEQSFIQRLLNTGTIKISSAGQNDFEIEIQGMPRPYEIKGIIDLHRTPLRQKQN